MRKQYRYFISNVIAFLDSLLGTFQMRFQTVLNLRRSLSLLDINNFKMPKYLIHLKSLIEWKVRITNQYFSLTLYALSFTIKALKYKLRSSSASAEQRAFARLRQLNKALRQIRQVATLPPERLNFSASRKSYWSAKFPANHHCSVNLDKYWFPISSHMFCAPMICTL